MKRILAAMVLAVATSAALPALAATWTDPSTGIEWTYRVISGEAEIYSEWHKSAIPATTTGAVTVPSTLGGYPVRRIENWAFYGCTNITSVTIPNSVTRIGNSAFEGCSAMSSVTIPSSVIELGAHAFSECSALTEVTIPSSVTNINKYLFSECTSLSSVTIPDSVTNIGQYAFAECTSLAGVTLPAGLTSLGQYAFNYCTSLGGTIAIPDGVTEIGSYAFEDCKIEEVTMGRGVKKIREYAFFNCTALWTVVLGRNVAEIEGHAFAKCKNMHNLTVYPSVKSIAYYAFWNANFNNIYVARGDSERIRQMLLEATKSGPDGSRLYDGTIYPKEFDYWDGDLSTLNYDAVADNGTVIAGPLYGCHKVAIADGATVTLRDVDISGVHNPDYKYAGIMCEGNATIILEGANVVKGYYKDYPGIYVPPGKKLTIKGDGSLTASSSGRGAGIGGGYEIACGHIDIEGGSVTATGGDYAAGIGSGYNADCGNILIKPGITHVTATHGANGVKPIGNGAGGEPAGYNAAGLSVKTVGATLYISPGTISGPDEISGAGETVLQDGDILTGEITGKRKISIANGATVTISDVTLDGLNEGGYSNTDWAGITCLGDATIILEGGNYVAGYNQYQPGIHVPVGITLTIKGGGSLTAEGAERAAGIGGAWKLACGNIVIESGHVEAHGGSDAAGIGGGFMGACGDIAIEGGYVWATGGNDAAGIGSGSFSSCGNITVTGGEVAATGNGYAAGIGGGNDGEIGSIYIGEGIVRVAATRGGSTGRDPIGGENGTVTISESLGDTLMDDGATRIIAPLVTVMFDANGGTVSPATRKVVKGGYIGELPVPVKSGCKFEGWFFNPLFNFYAATATDLASGSLTLYAKWTELPIPTLDPNVFCTKTLKELGYVEPSEGGPYTFSVKGLPAGLKFTAKDIAATAKQPAVAANSVYGTPTKPGIYEVTVTAKSAANKKGVETKVTVRIANITDAEIPVADIYGTYIPGVEYIEPITAAEGCSVSGLPSGMKWTAKDVIDSKTKTLKVPANSAYGVATKPGNYTVTFTKTVDKVKHTATATFKVGPLPVLTVETTGNGTGKVTGAGAYAANKVVTLKATADTKDAAATDKKPATRKSVFMGWYLGDTLISQAASLKYTMPEDSTMLKAKFITVAEEAAALSATVGGKYEFVASAPTSKNATVYAGVYVEWPVEIDGATPTTAAVSGLPAGLKFTAKDIMKKGSKTEVEVPANTIYGAPTAASKIDGKTSQPVPSKVKITLTTAGKSKYAFDLNLTVEPMEEWAVGTFEGVGLDDDHKGIGGDSKGRYLHATFTVAANGKISGKVTTLAGETWTLTAPYFDWFSIYSPLEYRATLFDKSGNPFTLQLKPRYGINSYGFMNVWFGTNGWIDPTQVNWNEESWKDAAKPLAKAGPLVIPTTDIDGNPGELTLKFASSGKVTYTAKFANYSASGSSSLEHDSNLGSGGAFDAKLTVLLPAKAGKFPGCIKHLRLKWDGTQFTNVYEM